VLREREEKRDLEGKWQNLLNLEECGSVRSPLLLVEGVTNKEVCWVQGDLQGFYELLHQQTNPFEGHHHHHPL
jgi:hypothetical protein